MAKQKTSEYMNVSYRLDDANSNDTMRDVSMNWTNRTPEEVRANLNIWLTACGLDMEVVPKVKQ
jgi:hypothetical protein